MRLCRSAVPSYLRCCGHSGAAGKKKTATPARRLSCKPMPPLDRARWILPE
nr:MAG TPA: hypothetical protein [Caudoviricetes sp.]